MGFINLIFCKGHLSRPPQLKFRTDGSKVCEFSIALAFPSEPGKSIQEIQLDVSYPEHSQSLLHSQLQKDALVFVEGRLKQQRIRPEIGLFHPYRIVAKQVILLGRKAE